MYNDIYCIKCRNHSGNIDVQKVTTKNNKHRLSAFCEDCMNKKSQFISMKTGGTLVDEEY